MVLMVFYYLNFILAQLDLGVGSFKSTYFDLDHWGRVGFDRRHRHIELAPLVSAQVDLEI